MISEKLFLYCYSRNTKQLPKMCDLSELVTHCYRIIMQIYLKAWDHNCRQDHGMGGDIQDTLQRHQYSFATVIKKNRCYQHKGRLAILPIWRKLRSYEKLILLGPRKDIARQVLTRRSLPKHGPRLCRRLFELSPSRNQQAIGMCTHIAIASRKMSLDSYSISSRAFCLPCGESR